MVGPVGRRKNNLVFIPSHFHSKFILHIFNLSKRTFILFETSFVLIDKFIYDFSKLYVILSNVVSRKFMFKLILKRLILSEYFFKQVMKKLSNTILGYKADSLLSE